MGIYVLLPLLAVAPTRVTTSALELVVDEQARVTVFGPLGTNLAVPGQPFGDCVAGGQRQPATALSVAGDRWTVRFGDQAAAELEVRGAGEQIDVKLVKVTGQPDEVTFARLVLQPGATAAPNGLLNYPDQTVGVIAGSVQTYARSALGKTSCTVSATAHAEADLTGCACALLAAPTDRAAAAIAAAEERHGIPLGIKAKQGEANRRSYLMIHGVSQANADQVVEWASRAHLGQVLLLHGTWGSYAHGYAVPERYFPDGLAGLKAVVDKFHAAGVLVGAHCFATKIPKNADRVHPVPDKRLYQDLETALAADVAADGTDLQVAGDLTDWPRPTGTRDLLIDDEIIIYESCSDRPPWTFRNCRRGAYGTVPAAHRQGARVAHLATDESRGIFIIDQNTTLLDEHAGQLAATYNGAGFDWIYFDGAEDVPPPRWMNYSRGKLAVLNKLHRPPVTVESAAHGPFCWHLDTRTGQRDYYWISPSPKDEVDDAALNSVARARRSYMVPDLGWFPISGASGGRGGRGFTPLDDIEYVFGKAAATDSIVSVLCTVDGLLAHPHLDAALDIIGRYERMRLERRVDERTRELLLRQHRDSMMVVDDDGEKVVNAREMPFVGHDGRAVRCMITDRLGDVVWCSLFNVTEPVILEYSLDPRRVEFFDHRRQPLKVEVLPGARLRVPVTDRVLMRTKGIHPGEINMALRGARVDRFPPEAVWVAADQALEVTGTLALIDPPPTVYQPLSSKLLATTGRGRNDAPDSFATYRVTVPKPGAYRVYPRIWSLDTNTNSFWLVPPDGAAEVFGNYIGDYDRWLWHPPTTVTVTGTEIVLKVGNRESKPNESPLLSAICLVPATSYYQPEDRDAAEALLKK